MMHGHEKSDSAIVASEADEQSVEAHCGGECGGASGAGGAKGGGQGEYDQQSTHWTQSQARVSQALERIRQAFAVKTRGRSRMRESCTYGSVRGARHEMGVPCTLRTA